MNLLKFKIAFLASALLLSCSVLAQVKGDSFAKAKSSKLANVVYEYLPISVYVFDKNGEVVGITADIMAHFQKYVKSKYGITMQVSYNKIANNSFGTLLGDISSSTGGVFGIVPVVITPQRMKSYDFSAPYLNNIELVITAKSVSTLSSLDNISKEFAGKIAYSVEGSANSKLIVGIKKTSFSSLNIEYVASFDEVVKKVANNPDSFAFINFAAYLGSDKYKKLIKAHFSASRNKEEFGIVLSKGNDWTPVLSEFINSGFIGSTEYNNIIRKYLGESSVKLINTFK